MSDTISCHNFYRQARVRSRYDHILKRFIAFMAFCLLSCMTSGAAHAGFLCPGGPGPGEYQVGVTPGGNGVAPVPICESNGSNGPASAPMRWTDNYFAIAWHKDASAVWMVVGFDSFDDAANAALASCNRSTGGGCTIATKNVNGAAAVGRGNGGHLYMSYGKNLRDAKSKVMQYCKKQQDECDVFASLTAFGGNADNNPEVHPPKGNFYRIWASVARVQDGAGSAILPDTWIATGRRTAAEAERTAVEACTRDSGRPCATFRTISDTYLTVGIDDKAQIWVGSAASPKLADKSLTNSCKKAKAKCRMSKIFAAFQNGPVIRHRP